jgi:hypothetical protein
LCLSLSKPAGPTVQATVSALGAVCTWLGLWPYYRGSSDEERHLGKPGCLFRLAQIFKTDRCSAASIKLGRVLINRDAGLGAPDVRLSPNSGAKADIAGGSRRARTGLMHRSKQPLFDHFIRDGEQRGRYEVQRKCDACCASAWSVAPGNVYDVISAATARNCHGLY